MKSYENIDEYLANFSGEARKKLDTIRKTIQETVPEAKEKISYGIPTFTFHGNLIHFAGYETHIGLYPGSVPIAEFAKDLAAYKTSKGTVQFPLHKPLPLKLISKMVKVCSRGHTFRKSSNSPVCPACWPGFYKKHDFPSDISGPALRALLNANITKLEHLSKFTEAELSALHGMGPKAVRLLKAAMKERGIKFS